MNLKSLLIGSAAALVAAPAFAADVIIAEPEPVEYVEVCDVAGAGYFYIPGSRTCLQIAGRVQHRLDFRGDRDLGTGLDFEASADTDVFAVDGVVTLVDAATGTAPAGATLLGTIDAGTATFVPDAAGLAALAEVDAPAATLTVANGGTLVFTPGAGPIAATPLTPAVAAVDPTLVFTPFAANLGSTSPAFDGIRSRVRARVEVSTFTETELGDLTSYIQLRSNDENVNDFNFVANVEDDQIDAQGFSLNGSTFVETATIGLGGLSLGMGYTLFDQAGGIPGEFDSFGGNRAHFISYTADLGAFSATIAAEVERNNASRLDYLPNIAARISGDVGAFSVDLVGTYDDFDGDADDGSFGVKAKLGADIGAFGVNVAGTYFTDAGHYDTNGFEYSVGASVSAGLGEKATLNFGGQYLANANNTLPAFFAGTDFIDGIDEYRIGADVTYTIVDGFEVQAAVNYRDTLIDGGAIALDVTGDGVGDFNVTDDSGGFDGYIEFTRKF